MSNNTYMINDREEVIPYNCGRKNPDTTSWRYATELELQQQEEIAILEAEIARLKEGG